MRWLNDNFMWKRTFFIMLLGLGHGMSGKNEEAGSVPSGQERGVPVSPAAVQELIKSGNQALNTGHHLRAAVLFESAYRLGAPNQGLAATLGNIWYVEEDFSQALFWYDQQIRRADSVSPQLQLRRMEVLYRLGEYTTAQTVGETILAGLQPGEDMVPDVQGLLGYVAFQSGKKDQAVRRWQQALDGGFQDPSVLRFLGNYFLEAENYSQALKYLVAYATHFPENREVARLRVTCLLHMERLSEAASALVTYLEYFAGDEQAEELLKAYIYFARREKAHEIPPRVNSLQDAPPDK